VLYYSISIDHETKQYFTLTITIHIDRTHKWNDWGISNTNRQGSVQDNTLAQETFYPRLNLVVYDVCTLIAMILGWGVN
jgi:hypothetical protein